MDVPGHYIDFKLIKRIFAQFSLHLSIFLLLFYLGYTTIRDLFLSEVGYIVFYVVRFIWAWFGVICFLMNRVLCNRDLHLSL